VRAAEVRHAAATLAGMPLVDVMPRGSLITSHGGYDDSLRYTVAFRYRPGTVPPPAKEVIVLLNRMAATERVQVSFAPLTKQDCEILSRLVRLDSLRLELREPVNAEDTPDILTVEKALRATSGLRAINPIGLACNDQVFSALSGHSLLGQVELYLTSVTDGGLRILAGLPRLKVLVLDSSALTERCLETVGQLPLLEHVWLDANIPIAAANRFRRAHPNVIVDRVGDKTDKK
jgi:hypothetical protein